LTLKGKGRTAVFLMGLFRKGNEKKERDEKRAGGSASREERSSKIFHAIQSLEVRLRREPPRKGKKDSHEGAENASTVRNRNF